MKTLVLTLFFSTAVHAIPSDTPIEAPAWSLTDISSTPEIRRFFQNADAIITTKTDSSPENTPSPQAVLVFQIKDKPDHKLSGAPEWQNFIKSYLKSGKRVVINEDVSKAGQYTLEINLPSPKPETESHMLYLALQNDDSKVVLLSYDFAKNPPAQNAWVKTLFDNLDHKKIAEMYLADSQRHQSANLKPAPPSPSPSPAKAPSDTPQ